MSASGVFEVLQYVGCEPNLLVTAHDGSFGVYYLGENYIKHRDWDWVVRVGAQGEGIRELSKLELLVKYGFTTEDFYKVFGENV